MSSSRVWTTLLFAGSAVLMSAPQVKADIFNFAGFAPVNVEGSAIGNLSLGYSGDGTTFQLTDFHNDEGISGFFPTPQNITGFTATFTYQSLPGFDGTSTVAADGISFIIESSASGSTSSLGAGGGSRGYVGIPGPSAALSFDNFGGFYFYGGATGFNTDGTAGTPNGLSNINLSTGNPFTVSLAYAGTTMTETLTNPSTSLSDTFVYTGIDLPAVLGTSTAYIGFSGATGGYNSTQKISNFSYVTTVPEPGSWMALVSGAGVLGWVLRRRRA